jgi:hydroxyethylthiazole kinase-like uncharacterized protein yjeF
MHALYTNAELRAIEQAAPGRLMERAGEAAAKLAFALLDKVAGDAQVLVMAGPGNNGGDAFEVAAHMALAGWPVTVAQSGAFDGYGAAAQHALEKAQQSGAHFVTAAKLAPQPWALIIDGLFGIGLQRPLTGELRSLVKEVNRLPCPRLALDVPSGLDAERGTVIGDMAFCATHTITFIGDKPGLHTADGRDHAGTVTVASLAIEAALFPAPHACLNAPELFRKRLQPRLHNSHKGSYGDVAVVGGAQGMGGAAILAARAAARCGAGRVFAGFIGNVPAYDQAQPELMCRPAAGLELDTATLVLGPGMGDSGAAHEVLRAALLSIAPLVLDADALNLIAADASLQALLAQRQSGAMITPHPLEAARLLGCTSATVQADRLASARELAQRYQVVVVLKGSGTVIARPDQFCVINATGNAGLATAGSGDVLAGICGALLAQGWPMWEAALGAVWLHGHAADVLVNRGIGPIGLTASELIPEVRLALNESSGYALYRNDQTS